MDMSYYQISAEELDLPETNVDRALADAFARAEALANAL